VKVEGGLAPKAERKRGPSVRGLLALLVLVGACAHEAAPPATPQNLSAGVIASSCGVDSIVVELPPITRSDKAVAALIAQTTSLTYSPTMQVDGLSVIRRRITELNHDDDAVRRCK
jgi:hypothetical protein